MAVLKDSLVTGDLRVTGTIYGDVPLNDLVDADDLKAIEALTGTSGLLKKTAANTWTLDTTAYKTGTVTSVRVQATSPVVSSVNTAQSSSLNTTISLADNYGDTKNPYASKTARYVLAAPASAAGVPSFRALTNADVGLGNVENTKLSTWAGSTAITTLGTISTGTIPWANISDKPSQATSWPNWGQILQSGANNIEEGTANFTDNTEIFSSYASNNGFADTNAPGKVYRRGAIKLYNYIKGKTDTLYATVGHNHNSSYVNVSGDTMTGALTLSGDPTSAKHAATKQYVDQSFAANDAMVFKGTIGSSGATVTALPATHNIGWTYRVLTAGTYAGVNCEIGDLIICITDGTSANNAHWTVAQTNLDGAVIGPASATSGNIALFDGTTGKLIKNSSYSPSSFATAGHNHDATYVNITGDTMTGALIIKKTTAATNTYADANPKIIFQNNDASQNASLTFTDYDSVLGPASLTLNGNHGNEWFIAPNIKVTRAIKQLITGSGTAAKDAGEDADPRYFPAKWTFNTGLNASDGDIFTIKIPVAGHDYGVFMSVNNGSNYYPVVASGTGRITTHYPANTYIQVVFESSSSAASMFPLAGGNSRVTVSGGVFRVINYYDSNTTYSAMSVAEMEAGTATSSRLIRADRLKTFLSTLGGTALTLTHNATDGLVLNHDNYVTAGTAGTSSATSGITLAVPYVTYNAQGHITATGTHTHTIPDASTSAKGVIQIGTGVSNAAAGNHNHDSTYVKKTGDTMTGSLVLENTNLIFTEPGITKGTNPSATKSSTIYFTDVNGGTTDTNRTGLLYHEINTSGRVKTSLFAYDYASGSGVSTAMQLSVVKPLGENGYATVSGMDVDTAVLRNIRYGTDAPTGGSNGEIYIQYS